MPYRNSEKYNKDIGETNTFLKERQENTVEGKE